jgi:hypothetical protein
VFAALELFSFSARGFRTWLGGTGGSNFTSVARAVPVAAAAAVIVAIRV